MKKYLLLFTSLGVLAFFGLTSFSKVEKFNLSENKKNSYKTNPARQLGLYTKPVLTEFESQQMTKPDKAIREQVMQNISQLPLMFQKNMGQWQKEILYRASAQGAQVGFRKNGVTFFSLKELEEHDEDDEEEEDGEEEQEMYETMVWNLNFKGMNSTTQIVAEGEVAGVTHYLLGNDSTKWIRNTPESRLIKYKGIYDNIDLHYYGLENHKLEYDYIVKPGGSIASIKMVLEGAGKLTINSKGELIITTPWGKVAEARPYSYQVIDGVKKEVDIRYNILDDATFGFKAYEAYDANYDLIIDPKTLVWSTYTNGLNTVNYVYDIGIDASRNVYATGYTNGNLDITAGVVQTALGGSEDVFVCKLNRRGTALLYCTYLGGGGTDRAFGIAVSSTGNAYITGSTTSSNFPTVSAIDAVQNSTDAFVSSLNNLGTSLFYSTYVGGGSTDWGKSIFLNSSNQAYVTGVGHGNSSNPFPTTLGAYRENATAGTSSDAFVIRLGSGGANQFCTLLGANNTEEGNGIFVTNTGEIYVTGETSGAFPVTAGCYDNSFGGSTDIFVAKLDAAATTILYATYIGAGGADVGEGIFVEKDEAYIVGRTNNNTYPVTAGAFQTTYGGGSENVVTKLNTTGSALVYSSFLGGSGTESQNDGTREADIVVNSIGQAYVSGVTTSSDFPVVAGSYDVTSNGGDDGYLVVVAASGASLLCATYFGGDGNDYKRVTMALDFNNGVTDTVYATITNHSNSSFDSPAGTFPIAQTQGAVYSKNHQVDVLNDQISIFKMVSCIISPLPIELASFKGTSKGDHNLLEWTTAMEINNDYFSIERSSDGVNFVTIGTVDGAGNSGSALNYSYSDQNEGNEITYYRLKQTDIDGKISYSKVVVINAPETGKALELTITSPVTDYLNYRVCCLQKGDAKVEVTDMSGKIVINTNVQVNEGYNKLTLDVKVLAEGAYILKLISDNGTVSAKFVK